ncbi:hypothetical protein LshimejAT787_2100500 [Lyophyllum shimeji]|uniref:Uncharacterized protein n=1 Tax=Lyophyllum shimeji TaxID=47721 RepID=A0A9P3Q0C4_LYOSH|nr:hypothetical protein LshimejAT787_2100500 [Lyophyllum shimeji]
MSSPIPTPSKSRLARLGGAVRRTSTLLSSESPKASPSTPPAQNGKASPTKAPAVVAAAGSPPKRGASQASLTEEKEASPAKSRLARLGGTLRRNSSLLSGKAPTTPSVAADSDSTSSKGSAAAPIAIKSHKRGASQGSVDGSVKAESVTAPSKSPLARIGGALRRNSSRTSLKGSASTAKPDADSASVKRAAAAPVPVTSPKRRASQASLVDQSGAGGTTASKSKLARIGGIVRRSSSRASASRLGTPSIAPSDRDADSTSVKDAVAESAAPSSANQPVLAETSGQETAVQQDTPSAADLPTLAPVAVSLETESLPRELAPLSPVQENPSSPVEGPAAAGPGAFTDEPEELPQPQVTRDLSLSQMEWVDEPEPAKQSIAQPDAGSTAAIETAPAESSPEPVPHEPLLVVPSPEPATTPPAATVPQPEASLSEPVDAKPTSATVASETVAEEMASAANASPAAEPVLLALEETQPAPATASPNIAKLEVAADIPAPSIPPASSQATVPAPAPGAAAPTSAVPCSGSTSEVPATTTQNAPAPAPRSAVTWTLGSIIAEGISILLRLVWSLRRASRT